MNFFIKKNSTYPELKYPLTQAVLDKYDITDDMIENAAITFSMINSENGLYKIANVIGNLLISDDRINNHDEVKYTLNYKFKLKDTNVVGRYSGEFCIDFTYGGCGKLKLPLDDKINIIISDSITETTII
jgi:hypothetical protein